MDELKRRLIDVCCGLEQSIFDKLRMTSGEEDFARVSMLKDDFVTFNATSFDCYIFH